MYKINKCEIKLYINIRFYIQHVLVWVGAEREVDDGTFMNLKSWHQAWNGVFSQFSLFFCKHVV